MCLCACVSKIPRGTSYLAHRLALNAFIASFPELSSCSLCFLPLILGFQFLTLPTSFVVPCFPPLQVPSPFPSQCLSPCCSPFSCHVLCTPLSPTLLPFLLIPLLFFFLLIHLLRPPRFPHPHPGASVLMVCTLPYFLQVQGKKG